MWLLILLIGMQARADFCGDLLALPLPVVPQTTDFTCGVACFDSVLRYWRGRSPGERALAAFLGATPQAGTSSKAILGAAHWHGLFAMEQFGANLYDIRRFLVAGETIYVSWSPGAPHYSLVRGLGPYHITLMDPWHAREYPGFYNQLSSAEFLRSWTGHIIRISGWPLFP